MKKKISVPVTKVSANEEIQRMRDLLKSGNLKLGSDGSIREDKHSINVNYKDDKEITVPETVLSEPDNDERSISDLIKDLRGGGEDMGSHNTDSNGNFNQNKIITVPDTILSARQWYQDNPGLLRAEIKAMKDFMGDNAELGYMNDGRAFWHVHFHPRIANKPLNKCREYDLLLVYDSDHPKAAMGSSVKAYPLKPSIDDLQEAVNRSSVYPKKINHLIRDSDNELYLCTTRRNQVSTDISSSQGLQTAATSLGRAMRWINIFELGLLDQKTWTMFQTEGAI